MLLPDKKNYDIFLVDNLHFQPVMMKMMRMIRKNQKIVVYMGSHTLYFIYAHRFSKINEWLHIQVLKRYDAIICEGKMAADLVNRILKEKAPKTYIITNGIPSEHYQPQKYTCVIPDNRNILFIGHISSNFRAWYKGIDLMVNAFSLALKKLNGLNFTIVGSWDKNAIAPLLQKAGISENNIHFTGETTDLHPLLKNASLYLHCARGEAFGLTILIAMSAGVVPIVSDWTGAKEVVELVDARLIVPLDQNIIAEKIIWFYNLPHPERVALSEKCRAIAANYTEQNAIENFRNTFLKMASDFDSIK
jgi:glycosyltransferase involved in cell wall biosynthesis